MSNITFCSYRLYFPGPIHIGDARPDDYGSSSGYMHSDAFYAAVIATWAKIGISIPENGHPGFAISSLFPFTTTGKDIVAYFFPKVRLRFVTSVDTSTFAKQLKRLDWLDQHYFEKQINGEDVGDFGGKNHPHLRSNFASTFPFAQVKEGNTFITRQNAQRVTVPRNFSREEDPTPFFTDRQYFTPNSGLYFLFNGSEEARQRLESALDLLQHEGIGTDRNVGNGCFTWQTGEVSLRVPAKSTHSTNLGLFCPIEQKQLVSMLSGGGGYEVIKRGGWVTDLSAGPALRKRSIHMFLEGSIFCYDQTTGGRPAIDIRPLDPKITSRITHPVWRSGYCLFIPVTT